MDALPANSLALPSRCRMSTTDESRPPKRAGIAPLYSVTSSMASELKTERKPRTWAGL